MKTDTHTSEVHELSFEETMEVSGAWPSWDDVRRTGKSMGAFGMTVAGVAGSSGAAPVAAGGVAIGMAGLAFYAVGSAGSRWG